MYLDDSQNEDDEIPFVANQAPVEVDQILPHLGEFGKFQKLLEVLLCFSSMLPVVQILLPFFTHDSPTWKCVGANSSCSLQGELPIKNRLRCSLPRSSWEYTTPKDYSIVTQFDLLCSKEVYPYISSSTFFMSWAVGAVTLGWLTDRYGRLKILLVSKLAILIVGLASAFSPNFAFYVFTRVVIGFFIPGTVVIMFVMASELVGTKYRPLAGMLLWASFALALIVLGIQAYFIRKWKYLIIVSTTPYFWLLLYFRFIPESIRWLQSVGRVNEAMEILRNIAKYNSRRIPDHLTLSSYKQEHQKPSRIPLLNIFRPKKMAFRTLIQGFIWMVESMVFFGLTLAADNLGGSNRYVNFILVSLVDLPTIATAIYLCKRLGRKKTTAIPLFIGSILCITVAFIPAKAGATGAKHWPIIRVVLGLAGKFFATVSFNALYTWSVEIYPTDIRGEGMGYMQIKARIGAALAPWVSKWLHTFHASLPFLVIGGAAFFASFLALWLPETGMEGGGSSETVKVMENGNLPHSTEKQDNKETNGVRF